MKKFIMMMVLICALVSVAMAEESAGVAAILGISEAQVSDVAQNGTESGWTRRHQQLLQDLVARYPGLAKVWTRKELKRIVLGFTQRIENLLSRR